MAYRNTRSGTYKTFKHYLELPTEVRKMINEEMDVKDMCRFTRCSSSCNKEVKRSDKYIDGLTFDNSCEQNLTVTVYHARFDHQYDYQYQVVFQADSDKKCMKYSKRTDSSWTELWKVDLDSSVGLVQMASAYFKKLLEFYQNSIKSLHITGEWNHDVEVRNLNNLKSLDLKNCVGNIMEVISRRKKPLERFLYRGEMDERLLEADEFIYQVQSHLYIPWLKLNIDQFRRLSTKSAMIHIGIITPTDVFNFITSWKNGQLSENYSCGFWYLNDSTFDIQELWQLLQVEPDFDPRCTRVRINHNLDARRRAMLHYLNYEGENERLAFRVASQRML